MIKKNSKKRKTLPVSPLRVSFVMLILAILAGIVLLFLYGGLQSFDIPQKPVATIKDFSGRFLPQEKIGYFLNQKVATPQNAVRIADNSVLGTTTQERWVDIDLSEQKLRAWEGNALFLETLVSTGKWGRTPTGEFRVWAKFRYTTMEGGDKNLHTYYYLPNVPYVMFFGNSEVPGGLGYSLHGTYWHNNFGTPMSHGCVNLPTSIAEKIFNWAGPVLTDGKTAVSSSIDNPGLRVVIHE